MDSIGRNYDSGFGGSITVPIVNRPERKPLETPEKPRFEKQQDTQDRVRISPEALQKASEGDKSSIANILNTIEKTKHSDGDKKVVNSQNSGSTGDHHHDHGHEEDDHHHPHPHQVKGEGETKQTKRSAAELGSTLIKYRCSKGDVEFHSARDSEAGVRAHEQRHIDDFHQMAKKHGLKVVDERIQINYGSNSDLDGMMISTGGHAEAKFVAEIDGNYIPVELGTDGSITDSNIARMLEEKKAGGQKPLYL
jgi:hypothetical protein